MVKSIYHLIATPNSRSKVGVRLDLSVRNASVKNLMTQVGAEENDLLLTKDRGVDWVTNNSIRLFMSELGNKASMKDCYTHRFRYMFCIVCLWTKGMFLT